METISVLERKNASNTIIKSGPEIQLFQFPEDQSLRSHVPETLLSQGSEDFYNYIQWTGLAKETGLMVLLPISHYYYDVDDLKGIRILVSQKKLNYIKHLDSFLHTLFNALPSNAYFLGCFKCNDIVRNDRSLYTIRKFENVFLNRFDPHNERLITKKGVSTMLEGHGLKVINLTDFNGITYFCSRVIKRSGE